MTSRAKREPQVLDIDGLPELLELAESVKRSARPCALRRGGETVAVVVPPPRRWKKRSAEEDHAAFLSARGSWGDVDVEAFLRDVYEDRDLPDDREIPAL
ncbi:MAG: hypothetical protein ACR2HN_01355 [Tepidiformaceae bacterium]